jgi:hypothetical protein
MSEGVYLYSITLAFGTVALLGSLRFLRGILERRHEGRIPVASEELFQRLERIEMSIEAIAVEVERGSEAQRFVAKLLAERSGAPGHAVQSERVITPH